MKEQQSPEKNDPPITPVTRSIESIDHKEENTRSEGVVVTFNAPRFIRFNPRFDFDETFSLLSKELSKAHLSSLLPGPAPTPKTIPWLLSTTGTGGGANKKMSFFSIPEQFSLQKSECYQKGRIYGMDISSGAAVAALLLDDYNKCEEKDSLSSQLSKKSEQKEEISVLDLCCAPGLKTCAIVDLLLSQQKQNSHTSSEKNKMKVVGVDISKDRLNLCKKILHKYLIHRETSGSNSYYNNISKNKNEFPHVQLYCQDGTTFDVGQNLVFDSQYALEQEEHMYNDNGTSRKRKRVNKSARARERKAFEQILMDQAKQHQKDKEKDENNNSDYQNQQSLLFDYVLVDAECGTDGSLHTMKHKTKKNTKNKNENEDELVQLQKKLILNGFRRLKIGGSMVYSTCSLSYRQDEEVVKYLLESFPEEVKLVPLSFLKNGVFVDNNSGEEKRKNDIFSKFIIEGSGSNDDDRSLSGTIRFLPNKIMNSDHDTGTVEQLGENVTMKPSDENDVRSYFGGGFFLAKLTKR